MKKFFLVTLVLAFVCMTGSNVFADLTGSITILPIGDAPVYESPVGGFDNDNFDKYLNPEKAQLWTGNWYGGLTNDSRSYLKFQIPNGFPITSTLLHVCNSGFQGGTDIIGVYGASNNWEENTITWNNQPGLSAFGSATLVDQVPGWFTWDITSLMHPDENGYVSFVLSSQIDGPGKQFWARESDNSPYISANVSAVPEPATMAMFGFGGLVSMILKRKKKSF